MYASFHRRWLLIILPLVRVHSKCGHIVYNCVSQTGVRVLVRSHTRINLYIYTEDIWNNQKREHTNGVKRCKQHWNNVCMCTDLSFFLTLLQSVARCEVSQSCAVKYRQRHRYIVVHLTKQLNPNEPKKKTKQTCSVSPASNSNCACIVFE